MTMEPTDSKECPEMFDLVWPTDIIPDDEDDDFELDEYGFPMKLGDFYAS